jgi:hypothetical protein
MGQKRKTEDQILIREITGNGKFLQLNMDLISKLGITEAVLITHILDKLEFWISIEKITNIDDGVIIYRQELSEKFGLSDYLQRKAESRLSELNVLEVVTRFNGKERYNVYFINLEYLVALISSYEVVKTFKGVVYRFNNNYNPYYIII